MSKHPDSRYTLIERLFGPKVTDDEIINLEIRAVSEDWYEVLCVLLDQAKNRRAKRFVLAYLRDGLMTVEVHYVDLAPEDVYQDDDPYEGFGLR